MVFPYPKERRWTCLPHFTHSNDPDIQRLNLSNNDDQRVVSLVYCFK